jgi:hypothetical protein
MLNSLAVGQIRERLPLGLSVARRPYMPERKELNAVSSVFPQLFRFVSG